MFRLSLFVATAVLSVLLLAPHRCAAAEPPEITGKYECKDVEADGKEYTSAVEITKKGDTYLLEWSMDGVVRFKGVGIRTDDILSVTWLSGVNAGVLALKIEKEGKLTGKWALLGGKGDVMKETLTPLKK
jgi:hypothetical protein